MSHRPVSLPDRPNTPKGIDGRIVRVDAQSSNPAQLLLPRTELNFVPGTAFVAIRAAEGETMDVLSDVLAAVRLTGAVFFDSTFRSEWVAEAPRASIIADRVMPNSQYVFYFHTLLEGSCWVELTDGSIEPIHLQAGDVIAFPMDDAHVLCSTIGMRAEPDLAIYVHPIDRQLPYVLNQGSGAESCHFVCGYLGCDVRPYNPFIRSLPRVLHGRAAASQGWLSHLVRHAVSETDRHNAGGETVLAKLAELLLSK